jgi:hypothetical protein
LSVGNLLLEAGDLGLRIELSYVACSASTFERSASAAETLALARTAKSKKGSEICRPKLTLFGVKLR